MEIKNIRGQQLARTTLLNVGFCANKPGIVAGLLVLTLGLSGCSRAQKIPEPLPQFRIDLRAQNLPRNFFQLKEGSTCDGQIISYGFVVWLTDDKVAVGFSTSPKCRPDRGARVDGNARLLVYNTGGDLTARRDLSYVADGNGELVAEGSASAGPEGTLAFGIESVNLVPDGSRESKSGVKLLDASLKDVGEIDHRLEHTTLVKHSLVFQEGFTLQGPRTYAVFSGLPPAVSRHWLIDWPIGTMDKNFGDEGFAFILCEQELHPGEYSQSNIIFSGANRHCRVQAETNGEAWEAGLAPNEVAEIIGLLADGSVVAKINSAIDPSKGLVILARDKPAEVLPWISKALVGSVEATTETMSRYAVFATKASESCGDPETACKEDQLFIFDRRQPTPLVNRAFPRNGKVALSPDGKHYATFEANELRIYSLIP